MLQFATTGPSQWGRKCSAVHASSQRAASAIAAHCIGHCSALLFQPRHFPVSGLMRLGFWPNVPRLPVKPASTFCQTRFVSSLGLQLGSALRHARAWHVPLSSPFLHDGFCPSAGWPHPYAVPLRSKRPFGRKCPCASLFLPSALRFLTEKC